MTDLYEEIVLDAPPSNQGRTLREYQIRAKDCVFAEFNRGVQSSLVVLPTGMGKTVLMSKIAIEWQTGNVLILAHRIELLDQAADKLSMELGYRPPVEQGERGVDSDCLWQGGNVIVGSVQTMRNSKRLEKFSRTPFGLIIIDEAHHATAASYRQILDNCLGWNPNCKVLGVTATPKRSDDTALGIVFDSLAFSMDMQEAIEQGWLVDIQQEYVVVDGVDWSGLGTSTNEVGERDFDRGELEQILTQEEALHAMATPILDTTSNGEQAIIFTAGVKHAHHLASVLNRHRDGCAYAVDGTTPKEQRTEIVEKFHKRDIQFLVNFGIFCLDEETEILTSDGWTSIDEMTYQHKVANWDNGKIFFEEPKFIVRRDRLENERMVVLETPRRSIRVTEDHRMLCRTRHYGDFGITHAIDLVGVAAELPVSGLADPSSVVMQQPIVKHSAARLRANSYVLRKSGMDATSALTEAKRRIEARDALQYTEPEELTDEDCEFIGFWIGDGSRCRLKSGGIEYTVAQSPTCPKIVARIDWLLEKIGTHSIKRRIYSGKRGDHFRWSMPRGTGFGNQNRAGLFRLEPYLEKDGTHLFWSLTQSQFGALLRGLWMADGDHGDNTSPPSGTLTACGINRDLFDLLQAIGVCRGYRVAIHEQKTKAAHHTPLLKFSARKMESHAMTTHRLRIEDGWRKERVWCVTTTTGNIVTRRRGTVTVTGNTEGFDAPAVSRIIMGRPTKSPSLYIQMLGRGTRPLPGVVDGIETAEARRMSILTSGKPHMIVLDFVGNSRHKAVSAIDALGGNYDVETKELAEERVRENGGDVLDELKKAKAEIALIREEKRRKGIKGKATYSKSRVDVFEDHAAPVEQAVSRGGASDAQIALLVNLGVDYDTAAAYGKRQAGAVITSLKEKRCSTKQASILKKYKYNAEHYNFDQASEIINAIAANGWRRPAGDASE